MWLTHAANTSKLNEKQHSVCQTALRSVCLRAAETLWTEGKRWMMGKLSSEQISCTLQPGQKVTSDRTMFIIIIIIIVSQRMGMISLRLKPNIRRWWNHPADKISLCRDTFYSPDVWIEPDTAMRQHFEQQSTRSHISSNRCLHQHLVTRKWFLSPESGISWTWDDFKKGPLSVSYGPKSGHHFGPGWDDLSPRLPNPLPSVGQ